MPVHFHRLVSGCRGARSNQAVSSARQAGQGLAGVFPALRLQTAGCRSSRKHIAGAHHAIHGQRVSARVGRQANRSSSGRAVPLRESIKPCGPAPPGHCPKPAGPHGAAMAGHHRPAAPLEDADFHRGIHSCTHTVRAGRPGRCRTVRQSRLPRPGAGECGNAAPHCPGARCHPPRAFCSRNTGTGLPLPKGARRLSSCTVGTVNSAISATASSLSGSGLGTVYIFSGPNR